MTPAADPAADPASQALSFGSVAEDYDRVRPGYPVEVVRWALGTAPLRVVDLGAGTGKLTRVLRAQGHTVLAVEPDARMRARLLATSPDVMTLAGTGEALPLPDASVDAVLVAQAWHWMEPVAASAELARVLRPGGVAVLLWHVRDREGPLGAAIAAAVAAHAPDLAARARADGRPNLAEVPDVRLVPDGSTTADSSVRMSPADLLALVSTWSYVALSPARDRVLADVAAAAAQTAVDGEVVLVQHVRAARYRRR